MKSPATIILTILLVLSQGWNEWQRRLTIREQERVNQFNKEYAESIQVAVDSGDFVKLPDGWKK